MLGLFVVICSPMLTFAGCVLSIRVLIYVCAGAMYVSTECTVNILGTTMFTHNSASEYGGENGNEISRVFRDDVC